MAQFSWHEDVTVTRRSLSRRGFLYGTSAAGLAGAFNFRDVMSLQAADLRKQGKAMILLFMQGGPSQLETFDPKPGTETGGPTQAINTAVSGIQIAEGWEKTAQQMNDIAVIRSMTNKEGQHERAVYQMHTGYIPSGSIKHPSLGCNIARELSPADRELPAAGLPEGELHAHRVARRQRLRQVGDLEELAVLLGQGGAATRLDRDADVGRRGRGRGGGRRLRSGRRPGRGRKDREPYC